mmetsp:Transcript_2355/g.4261  ORF Transcript_2355/g.4261 Transcript_2355/m.4261 type:complete len:127 (+) Transcript_2355:635-1015(+)
MDHRQKIGSLSCRLCGASFAMPINHLHEPVDVFSEWLDDCEATALGKPTGQAAAAAAAQEAHNQRLEYDISDDEEDDDNDLGGRPSGLSGGNASKSKGKKGGATGTSAANTNYANLGLDDSDEDSD